VIGQGQLQDGAVLRLPHRLIAGVGGLAGFASACMAGEIEVVRAWVAPTAQTSVDVALQMAVINRGSEADALLRLRCPFAHFSEKVVVDRGGEGPPARRPISVIAIKPAGETDLTPEGAHVMLLQTRHPLLEGERFVCAASFRRAGAMDVTVEVRRNAPAP
jgi:periplasmic copper chaperone A